MYLANFEAFLIMHKSKRLDHIFAKTSLLSEVYLVKNDETLISNAVDNSISTIKIVCDAF